jgi:hypothetical protein
MDAESGAPVRKMQFDAGADAAIAVMLFFAN